MPTTPTKPFQQPDPTNQPQIPLWKEYWYVTFLVIAFIILTISFIIRSLLPTPPAPNQSNTWETITPGYSTIQQAAEQLGAPIDSKQTNRGIETTFSSYNDFLPHQVVSDQGGTVRFAKEFIHSSLDHTLDQYINEYGSADLQLIDHESSDALTAHVFLEEGLVVLAHNADQTVEQKWYFEPTDEATFLNSWGINLETEGHGPELVIP